MPKRTDIHKILIIGSGPIVIGQACEFDYSGTQACKALREEGFNVVLVNSNPATIMTDPGTADRTYIEPITPEIVEKIIARERPDALLPTMGGQTGLNTAMELAENGVLTRYNVQLIGADYEAIKRAENRSEFKKAMLRIGLDLPKSAFAYNMDEAWTIARDIGFPLIIRPSFTMGGTGGGIVPSEGEFERIAEHGLHCSRINEIMIEESVIGWKEFELEIMRDKADNVVIICSIENLDPMGIHTGDSITVAPAQTLTDKQYQYMRDASIAIIREIGVETGGSNIQFAVNPDTGRMVVIEMNPRVSRSSALASKATGFPIAKFAAKLSVGFTLDEIQNDITRETPASFEPTIDYTVVKIPRFAFEKFQDADPSLGIQMKSVGETMAIGRTFKEALQKGLRGLEIGRNGFEKVARPEKTKEDVIKNLGLPRADRIFLIRLALDMGIPVPDISSATGIDPWFLENMREIIEYEKLLTPAVLVAGELDQKKILYKAKQYGFSDVQLGRLLKSDDLAIRKRRTQLGITTTYKLVDTCAAEFEAYTPYYYSTYEDEDEGEPSARKKIVILGGGPNRIGQGIEFDYCCCQASYALRELGYESIMVNSNPETVSTDYDTSDKLYFEPLTFEDVMNIIDKEKPAGVIVQFGGQTPLNLARKLHDAGAPIIGTSVASLERAGDRGDFFKMVTKLGLHQAVNAMVSSKQEACEAAAKIGYPVLMRPSFVLGGRAMNIVYNETELLSCIEEAQEVAENRPLLIDKFISDAIEVDVDAVSDGKKTMICGIMEHIEEAGIHSGDSACVLPPHTLSDDIIDEIKRQTIAIADELTVVGLLNIQYAIKDDVVFIIEVNPRASRTVPFVSKATSLPLAKIAARCMAGISLAEQGIAGEVIPPYYSVKEAVFPFVKFPGVDTILGPEMKSTGEVMGVGRSFAEAFVKSQLAAGTKLPSLPSPGKVFISVKPGDKPKAVEVARELSELGFILVATRGTATAISAAGIPVTAVHKVTEGRPHIVDMIKNHEISMIVNTVEEKRTAIADSRSIRVSALAARVTLYTTVEGARAACAGMRHLADMETYSLQALHAELTLNPTL
jgi:carbamoyl-phosphate synthase large subunit